MVNKYFVVTHDGVVGFWDTHPYHLANNLRILINFL